MTTAYIIHNSEGVPVRRILETGIDRTSLVAILVTAIDADWMIDTRTGKRNFQLGKYSEKTEREHHLYTRKYLQDQYGHRFEIYWPLSTIFS